MRIETPRLILREWKDEDLIPFAKLNADPVVMEHFPNTLTLEQTQTMIETLKTRFKNDGFSFFAVELKSTGEFIGMTGLNKPGYQTPFTPCVEVGWRIAKEFWNKGYATEAAKASLDFGFNTLGLDKIASFTAVENVKSQRIMDKIGMIRDHAGDFDHPNVPKDHRLCRHVLYWISK